MRVMVASDETSTRAAISLLISAQSDLDLVGDADDLAQLLEGIKCNRPDLVVLDWDALGKRMETLQELLECVDEPPLIVALSVHESARKAVLETGVQAFAFKGAPPSDLLQTIRAAHRGP